MEALQTQQSTAIRKPVDLLKATLNAPSVQEQFKNALGEKKDLFVASCIDLFSGDKSLQTCNPSAVVCEALKAAVLNMPINKALGFAYIVVYNNSVRNADGSFSKVPTPTFILGYKGLLQLAQRTGFYKTINADVVYEGELKGADKLSGSIDLSGVKASEKVVGYFAHFRLLNGFEKTLYMSVEEMAAYAKKYSPSINRNTTKEQLITLANAGLSDSKKVGWEGNFNDMALKTCVRKLISKYGYLSIEMQTSIANEIEAESNADRDTMVMENANSVEIDAEEVVYSEAAPSAPSVETPSQSEGPGF